ncbi:MAG: leucine-rich repeat domain-containing protein [Tidjanibacter sp.]|nr:leucine-rich repeat domain-containing protein [Tidjanibacter sp.]MBQ8272186.1 leucine-rich repeat domain-containing protein [Tidjanibacter sp.]
MKKFTSIMLLGALLCGCGQDNDDVVNPNNKVKGRVIYALFQNDGTKTYLDESLSPHWHAGDEISFFDADTYNSKYIFAGETGDESGEFNAVTTGSGTAVATTYGVYPYSVISLSTAGVLTVGLPIIQAYGVNSFGRGANTMVAVGKDATDDKLFFKNACGYLVIKLYNPEGVSVKSILLEGNAGEKIAGEATITATYNDAPSVAMEDDATTYITMDCGAGVEIGTTADDATEFWFVLPEMTFNGGITITATDIEGNFFKRTTTKAVSVVRNEVQPMKALSAEFVIPKPANTELWYTNGSTTTNTYIDTTDFDAKVKSHVYDSDRECWVITFDGDVTSIAPYAFRYGSDLTSITLPDCVTSIGKYAFQQCSNLASITLPNSVTSIGMYAFASCSKLASIIIPESVTSIGQNAFNLCTKLTEVYCKGTTPPTGGNMMFNNNHSKRTIFVPTESVDDYKTATYWKNYAKSIVEFDY